MNKHIPDLRTGSLERVPTKLYIKIAIGGTGAPTLSTTYNKGVASVSRTSAGLYVLTLDNAWLALLGFRASQVVPTGIGALTGIDLVSESVATPSTKRITFKCRAAAGAGNTTPTATDPVSGSTLMLEITLQDTSAK